MELIRKHTAVFMLCCRMFLAASLFVLLVVPDSLAVAALQKQPPVPRTVSSEVRAACEFPENRLP